MYSAYKLKKQSDNIQPWLTPFPIWTSPLFHVQFCCFLTSIQVSQEAGKVVWHTHLLKNFPQFVVIHTVKAFSIVNEAKVDVFSEFSCFIYDPTDVGNLISGSSAFCKSSLNTWKFLVHVLLKPSLENFEHYLASMWNEYNSTVLWTFFNIPFLWDCSENWPLSFCGHCWVFKICWHIECSSFTASSSRTWNSSAKVPSPSLVLFVVMLPKTHLISHSRMSGSRWVITPSWLSGSLIKIFFFFCIVHLCILQIK